MTDDALPARRSRRPDNGAAMAYTGLVLGVLALLALAVPSLGPAARFLLLLLFVCVAPGAALLSTVRLGDAVSSWALAFVLSLAVAGIVADVMLWTKFWHPVAAYSVVAWVAIGTAIAALRRRSSAGGDDTDASGPVTEVGPVPPARPQPEAGGVDWSATMQLPLIPPDPTGHAVVMPRVEPIGRGVRRPPPARDDGGPLTRFPTDLDSEPVRPVAAQGRRNDETAALPGLAHAVAQRIRQADETAVFRPRGGETTIIPVQRDATALIPAIREQTAPRALVDSRPDRAEPAVGRGPGWRSLAIDAAILAGALVLWLVSLATSSTAGVGDYGLLSVLSPPFFVALAVSATRFVVEILSARPRGWVMWAHTGLTIAVMHASVPLLVRDPEYAWTYKHIGVIEHFRLYGAITDGVDIYQQWPTMFAVVAHLVDASGADSLRVGAWAPVFFDLAFVLLLFAVSRTLTSDRRIPYLTAYIFTVINWVAQDYLSPQAFTFTLCLGLMLIMLRWLRRSASPSRWAPGWLRRIWSWANAGLAEVPYTAKQTRRSAILVLCLAYAVVVSAHQLSPYIVAMCASGLVLLGLVRPAQVIPIFLGIAVLYLVPRYEIAEHHGVMQGFSLLSIFNRVQGLNPVDGGAAGRMLSAQTVQFLSLCVWSLAALAVVAALRRPGPVAVPAVLAFSPFALILINPYGGEAIYRVFLFSAPWCAFLIATLLVRRRWLPRAVAVPLASAALVAATLASMQGLHGQLTFNQFTRAEVEAAQYLNTHPPDGSLIVLAAGYFPVNITGTYDRYGNATLVEPTGPFARRQLNEADLPAVNAYFQRADGAAFLVFSPVMARQAEYFGYLEPGALDRLQAAVSRSPNWTLYYENEDVTAYQFLREGGTSTDVQSPSARPPGTTGGPGG